MFDGTKVRNLILKFGIIVKAIKAFTPKKKNQLMCGKCGATGVRIYRELGRLRDPDADRCNECIDKAIIGLMVPCCLSEKGEPWGISTMPREDYEKFLALPDKVDLPYWAKHGIWSFNVRPFNGGKLAGEVCDCGSARLTPTEPESQCYCHISPPCHHCVEQSLGCQVCGWSSENED